MKKGTKKDKKLALNKGKRLKAALDYMNLIPADLTRNGRRSESQVSRWINGQVEIGRDSIKDIIEEYLPEIRFEYLMCIDDFMTREEVQAYYSHYTKYNPFRTWNVSDDLLMDYIYHYMTLKGFEKITIHDGAGNETPLSIKDNERIKVFDTHYPGKQSSTKFSVAFSSEESGEYKIDLSEWKNMKQEIHDFISFQVCKTIFKGDSQRFLSFYQMENGCIEV